MFVCEWVSFVSCSLTVSDDDCCIPSFFLLHLKWSLRAVVAGLFSLFPWDRPVWKPLFLLLFRLEWMPFVADLILGTGSWHGEHLYLLTSLQKQHSFPLLISSAINQRAAGQGRQTDPFFISVFQGRNHQLSDRAALSHQYLIFFDAALFVARMNKSCILRFVCLSCPSALINVKMIEMANQIKEGGACCFQNLSTNSSLMLQF